MLEKIRKAGHHFTFKILFLLIAIVFALSLLDFSNPNANVIITVGNHKISLSEFFEAKERTLYELGIPKEQALGQQNYIDMSVITQLISQSLIDQEVKELGLKIAPEVVIEHLKTYPAFQKNGEFDIETFKSTLAMNNLSEEDLINDISAKIAAKFLFDSLTANLPLKGIFSEYMHGYLTKKLAVSVITVDNSNMQLNNIDEAELKSYYQENKDTYVSDEYRSFDYLLINQDDLIANIKITDEDLQKEYQENKDNYLAPATRDFYHFLAPSQAVAEKVAQALNAGEDPSKVAKDFVASNVIAEIFNNQNDQSFLASVDPTVFQLSENTVTAPVKSDLGWHVFKILKIHPQEYKSFADAKEDIKNNLMYNLKESALNELLGLVEEDVNSGASFEDIATRTHVNLNKVEKIAADGTSLSPSKSATSINPGILELAFQMEEQDESAVTMLSDEKTYVIVKINEIIPSRQLNFEEAKNLVKNDYVAAQKNKITIEALNVLRNKLQEENQTILVVKRNDYSLNNKAITLALADIIAKNNINSQAFKIEINNQQVSRPELEKSALPDFIASQLFDLGLNQISEPQQITNTSYILTRVNQSISLPKEKMSQDLLTRIDELSEESYRTEIYDLYMTYLRAKYKVEVNTVPLNEYYAE